MRKKILAANWKMNKTILETETFFKDFSQLYKASSGVEIVIAPPLTSLVVAAKHTNELGIKLAAQNMHWKASGAFTGEVSAEMIKSVGCDAVILGHSERRHVFGESDELINKKINTALQAGLEVIFCVGETLQARQQNQTMTVLDQQLSLGLSHIESKYLGQLVIAYEPVWAIGTGQVATPEQAEEAHKHIRKKVWDLYNMNEASQIPMLYGGSVKADNIAAISSKPNIDGALVGGASLNAKTFVEIFERMA